MTDLTLDADLVAYVDQARADAVHAVHGQEHVKARIAQGLGHKRADCRRIVDRQDTGRHAVPPV